MHFRAGLADKRLKPVGGAAGPGEDKESPAASAAAADDAEGAATAAAAPAEAAPASAAGSEEEKRLLAELEKALAEKKPPGLPDDPRTRRQSRVFE